MWARIRQPSVPAIWWVTWPPHVNATREALIWAIFCARTQPLLSLPPSLRTNDSGEKARVLSHPESLPEWQDLGPCALEKNSPLVATLALAKKLSTFWSRGVWTLLMKICWSYLWTLPRLMVVIWQATPRTCHCLTRNEMISNSSQLLSGHATSVHKLLS